MLETKYLRLKYANGDVNMPMIKIIIKKYLSFSLSLKCHWGHCHWGHI